MAHLGDGVSNCVVDSSLGGFATRDVSNRDGEGQGRRHGCKSLETITHDKKYVRTVTGIRLSEADHAKTDRLSDALRSIRRNQHLDSLGNLKIVLHVTHGQTKIRRKVHPGNK